MPLTAAISTMPSKAAAMPVKLQERVQLFHFFLAETCSNLILYPYLVPVSGWMQYAGFWRIIYGLVNKKQVPV